MKTTSFLLLLFLFISCGDSNKTTVEHITIGTNNAFDFNQNFTLESIIKLETNDNCLLGSVRKVVEQGDYFFIQDSYNKVLLFDKNGAFIRQIGSTGIGPGTYVYLSDFTVNDSVVSLIDDINKKLVKYNINGDYITKVELDIPFSDVCKIDNLTYYNLTNTGAKEAYNKDLDVYYKLLVYDENRKLVNRLLPYGSNLKGKTYRTGSPFLNHNLYMTPLNDTVYTIEEANLIPTYVIDAGKYKRPQDFLEKVNPVDMFDVIRTKIYLSAVFNFSIYQDLVYFKAFSGQRDKMHVFYDKNSKESYTLSSLIDQENEIEVNPLGYYNGDKLLSVVQYANLLNPSSNDAEDDNPSLYFYKRNKR